jgi:outer membrane protein/protease secretion system outer membrane protein
MSMAMLRKHLVHVAALAACIGTSLPAWSLDLAEAYRLAYERDATIRQSRASAEAGREKLPQARAQLMPNVGFTASRGKNQLETTSSLAGQSLSDFQRYNSSNDTLQVRQPIYRKQLTAQYTEAKAQVANANALLEVDEQKLVMRVTEAYFNVLLADEQVTLIGLQKNAYAAQADAARKSFNAGTGTRTDIDEAQARYDLAVAQELEARQNAEQMRHRLQVLVDQPVTDIAPVDVRKLQLTAPAASLDEWIARADSTSAEVDAARAQIEMSRAEVDKARSAHYPTLDGYASLTRTNSDNVNSVNTRYYQKSVGVQLTVPLFSGGYVNSQVREALARLEASQDQLEALRRDLAVRVQQEFRGVTEGLVKVKALEQAVRSAEQLIVSSRRSFEAGVRTRLDILNAEQQAGQARRDLAQARFSYLLSRVRLRALAGNLRAENIDEINGWLQH